MSANININPAKMKELSEKIKSKGGDHEAELSYFSEMIQATPIASENNAKAYQTNSNQYLAFDKESVLVTSDRDLVKDFIQAQPEERKQIVESKSIDMLIKDALNNEANKIEEIPASHKGSLQSIIAEATDKGLFPPDNKKEIVKTEDFSL